jgi:hypothetical protein
MNTQQILQYSKYPETITISEMQNLEAVIDNFPYFQAARALYLKGLYNADSYKYNFELKKTAALTTERDVLFDFITSKNFSNLNNIKNIFDINVFDYEVIRSFPTHDEIMMIQENMEENHVINQNHIKIESINDNSKSHTLSSMYDDFDLNQSELIDLTETRRDIESVLNPKTSIKATQISENKSANSDDNQIAFYESEINEKKSINFEDTQIFFNEIIAKPIVDNSKENIINLATENSINPTSNVFEISEETFQEEINFVNIDSITKDEAPFTVNFEPIFEKLKIGKPIPFEASEKHSFFEWLKITEIKPIDRQKKSENFEVQELKLDKNTTLEEKKKHEKSKKIAIIDQFLETNPKISQAQKSEIIVPKIIENIDRTHLMTETLAKVYLEQKKYNKAIQAFQILILKNPEKSVYFADRIKDIKILQQNNS